MKIVNSHLYLSFSNLAKCGVSENTLKSAVRRNSKVFQTIKDPSDKRKILFKYEALNSKYRNMVLDEFGDPYEYYQSENLTNYLKFSEEAYDFYYSHELPDGKELPDEYKEKYTEAANYLELLNEITKKGSQLRPRKLGFSDNKAFYSTFIQRLNANKIALPTNYSNLRTKLRTYLEPTGEYSRNYESLISGKFANNNSRKISKEVGSWLIAQYSLPNKLNVDMVWIQYAAEAIRRGWPELKDSRSIRAFLMEPQNKRLWYGPRHGYHVAQEKYRYPLKTELPTLPNALWYGDGTKLNYFDKQGKLRAAWTVYEVIDVYSECLLGYHISRSEDYIAQYHAYKMAVKFAMAKPYELRTDNQGGHKKLKERSFLGKLSKVGFSTRAYNGKSKTIESVFGRLQASVMRKDWNFTGQNITAKKLNSKANMEFVLKNLKNLPTLKEVEETYAKRREEWNNGLHYKYKVPRKELYFGTVNPQNIPVTYTDMVELFWIETKRPITYYNHGLTVQYKNDKRDYEVLKDGKPDMDFRKKYIDQKFVVKFDPEDWSHIRLYIDSPSGLRFVAVAEPRLSVPRATIDYKPGSRALIDELLRLGNEEMADLKETNKQLEEDTGVRAEDLINPTLGSVMKEDSYKGEDDDLVVVGGYEDLL